MSDTEDDVIKELEEQGALSTLKARLRAGVYLTVLSHEEAAKQNLKKSDFKKLKENPQGRISAAVFRDFLQTKGLSNTLSVFVPETRIPEADFPRKDLETALGIKPESSQSLLIALLERLKTKQETQRKQATIPEIQKGMRNPLERQGEKRVPGRLNPLELDLKKSTKLETVQGPVIGKGGASSKHALMQLRENKEMRLLSQDSEEDIEEVIEEEPLEVVVQDQGTLGDSAGTSSLGADASADSLALESCDHVESLRHA